LSKGDLEMRRLIIAVLGLSLAGCVFQEMKELPAAPDLDMTQDMAQDMTQDMTQDMVLEDMPVDAPSDVPDAQEDMTEDVVEDVAEDAPEDMVDQPVDMPTVPKGTVCLVADPPTEACDPVEQTGCFPNQECKLILLQGVPRYTCLQKTSGIKEEGEVCAPGLAGECGASLTCVFISQSVGALCLNICQLSDARGCDGDGNYPACRNPVGTTGYGTCWPTCPSPEM
jgi:hypothetical protein